MISDIDRADPRPCIWRIACPRRTRHRKAPRRLQPCVPWTMSLAQVTDELPSYAQYSLLKYRAIFHEQQETRLRYATRERKNVGTILTSHRFW